MDATSNIVYSRFSAFMSGKFHLLPHQRPELQKKSYGLYWVDECGIYPNYSRTRSNDHFSSAGGIHSGNHAVHQNVPKVVGSSTNCSKPVLAFERRILELGLEFLQLVR